MSRQSTALASGLISACSPQHVAELSQLHTTNHNGDSAKTQKEHTVQCEHWGPHLSLAMALER